MLTPDGRRKRLVVAGFGMVAHKLVDRLAALEALGEYAVTIIGEEPYAAYNRVHLTGWLEHPDSKRLVLARPGWSRFLGIRSVTGTRVISIDREGQTVRTSGGGRFPYHRLILATGSAPFVPPIEGVDLDGVFVYRTIDDLKRIGERSAEAGTAAVVGGGLLGIEAAAALQGLGLRVVILESGPHLLRRQLDAEGAEMLRKSVCEMGVRPLMGAVAERIRTRGGRLALDIRGRGESVAADMVVFAAGIRPRDELARDCGLEVASGRGGIVVDDELRTSDPAIHAIGECASHNGVVHGLVAPGFRMAETLAAILAGRRRRFDGYSAAIRLRLAGIDVWSLGDHTQPGDHLTWRGNGSYRQLVVRERHLVAAAAVGPWEEIGFAQDAIRHERRIWPWQLHQFLETGRFSEGAAPRPVTEWPASAMVCNCLEVTQGTLRTASRQGYASVEALARRTGASTVCGHCRPLLSELVGTASEPAASKGHAGLLTAATIAMLLVLMTVYDSPVPPAASVESSRFWDVLYRDGWWRQVTGFALLGCALLAAGFSFRKRWTRVRWGDLGWWRLGHGLAGVLALIALAAHTGLRVGSGFNRILMISFLAASVFGAGAAAGMGHRSARLTFWLHLLAVWILPALIAIHIVASYYF